MKPLLSFTSLILLSFAVVLPFAAFTFILHGWSFSSDVPRHQPETVSSLFCVFKWFSLLLHCRAREYMEVDMVILTILRPLNRWSTAISSRGFGFTTRRRGRCTARKTAPTYTTSSSVRPTGGQTEDTNIGDGSPAAARCPGTNICRIQLSYCYKYGGLRIYKLNFNDRDYELMLRVVKI